MAVLLRDGMYSAQGDGKGFGSPGVDTWIQLDDITLTPLADDVLQRGPAGHRAAGGPTLTDPWGTNASWLTLRTTPPSTARTSTRTRALAGPDLCFTMSQWDPYNVYLMRMRLPDKARR